MALTPLTFTGVSQFSSDFQSILSRAVSIAQIPVKSLQNKDSDTLARKNLLTGLANAAEALAESLRQLGSTGANRALSASSSNPSKVSVTETGATQAAIYTIDSITSAATAASERTKLSYGASAPVSSNGSLKLVVGSQNFSFSLASNTLGGLRDKINSLNAGVSASILTTAGGNYLSLAANATGAKALQLFDDPLGANTNLLTASNQGTNAVFKLNGIDVSQPGNVVNNVVPGLTFSILDASSSPVTLSLASDRSKLSQALQSFVVSYNAAREQANAQIGPAAGLLSCDTVVTQLSNTLRQIGSYQTGSGPGKNLASLGVTFSASGEAKFDSAAFDSLPDSAIQDAFSFLGSPASGLGGFSRALTQLGDPVSGLIHVEQQGLDRLDRNFQQQIAQLNDRINVMQNALAARLHQSDALLATLTNQQAQLSASLQGLNLTLYGRSNQ